MTADHPPPETNGLDTGPYDRVAGRYESARPGYPDEIFGAIEDYAGFDIAPRVIEIGSGTGQATRQMTARGWSVEAVEPGGRLVSIARASPGTDAVRFREERFEDAAIDAGAFDLLVAATSWHWVDPEVGYTKAREALAPGGTIALFWNAHVPDTPDPRWVPVRQAYLEVAPELADLAPLTPDRPDYDPVTELRESGCFGAIERRVFPFEVSYPADRFLALLDTYASHDVLDASRRDRLYERLRTAIENRLGGIVTKPYEALLVLGRRLA